MSTSTDQIPTSYNNNTCFTDGTCNSDYLNNENSLKDVYLSDECADCLLPQKLNICNSGNNKPCESIVKAELRQTNTQNKTISNQYNDVVKSYNLFNKVLDTQSKLATKRWDTTNSTLNEMEETANNIMTKSRIIQLAEEEYESSQISMNKLLWFFISLIIVGILIFAKSYNQISSSVLLYSVLAISVIYLTYYFLSGYLHNSRYNVNKVQYKTEKLLRDSQEKIKNEGILASLKEKAREMVGQKCGVCPSSAPSSVPGDDYSPIPAFQNEADLYFDGSAPVQQIYPTIEESTNGDRVHFNTQPDYGQRDNCNNTADPKWLPSGLPKLQNANSISGGNSPSCNPGIITTQSPSDVIININNTKQCSGPNYSVPSNFGGSSTLIS